MQKKYITNNLLLKLDKTKIDDEIEIGDVYPNPTNDKINFELRLKHDNLLHFKIIDSDARIISDFVPFKHINGIHTKTIDVSDISNGVYFLIIESEFGQLARKINICR